MELILNKVRHDLKDHEENIEVLNKQVHDLKLAFAQLHDVFLKHMKGLAFSHELTKDKLSKH